MYFSLQVRKLGSSFLEEKQDLDQTIKRNNSSKYQSINR